MDKIRFSERELLEGYSVVPREDEKIVVVKLINHNVEIFFKIFNKKEINLDSFYKKKGINTKGIARCSLFVLLKKILEGNLVELETIVKVSDPTPDPMSNPLLVGTGGNMERLIKLYEEIGFTPLDAEPGNPINLISTVKHLIDTLKQQCEMTGRDEKYQERKQSQEKDTRHSTGAWVLVEGEAESEDVKEDAEGGWLMLGGRKTKNKSKKKKIKSKKIRKRKSKKSRKLKSNKHRKTKRKK